MSKLQEIEARDKRQGLTPPNQVVADRRYLLGLVKEMREALEFYAGPSRSVARRVSVQDSGSKARALLDRLEEA